MVCGQVRILPLIQEYPQLLEEGEGEGGQGKKESEDGSDDEEEGEEAARGAQMIIAFQSLLEDVDCDYTEVDEVI